MRNRIAILSATAVLPLTIVASLAAANQASADPKSQEVVVTGAVDHCNNDTAPRSVQITTSNETSTDVNRGVRRAGAYSVTFQTVPRNGSAATATVTCRHDSYQVHFTVQRPPGQADLVQEMDLAP
ncbi:hypothetical protein ACFVTY_08725 [Streptomyces sp. NPDC058067]|uniref:hypothetical protein n=1 Tax=Streptomyces sp. NPDC058067 TaxID=3346324 RepID=UPI0036E92D2E